MNLRPTQCTGFTFLLSSFGIKNPISLNVGCFGISRLRYSAIDLRSSTDRLGEPL